MSKASLLVVGEFWLLKFLSTCIMFPEHKYMPVFRCICACCFTVYVDSLSVFPQAARINLPFANLVTFDILRGGFGAKASFTVLLSRFTVTRLRF